jgi:dTDP-4-amino-4,6-dideoxygalactose transaminase
LIDYFGFPTESTCAREAKKRGAWLCKDASQALLSERVGELCDFVLFSPRKFVGVPDGGILVAKEPLAPIELQSPPAEWWLNAFEAVMRRRDFDRDYHTLRGCPLAAGGNRRWFELFRQSEAQAPIGRYAMSELSRRLLAHSFDYSAIARRRLENYQVLASHLSQIALKPTLLEGVVPLGFPIVLRERDKIRQALFEHEIYPPVHWPIAGIVPAKFQDSHRLAADLMTIPCDQRYEKEEMEWVSQIILNQLSN